MTKLTPETKEAIVAQIVREHTLQIRYAAPFDYAPDDMRYRMLRTLRSRVEGMLGRSAERALPMSGTEYSRTLAEAAHAVFDGAEVFCSASGSSLVTTYDPLGTGAVTATSYSIDEIGLVGGGIVSIGAKDVGEISEDTVALQAESYLGIYGPIDMRRFSEFENRITRALLAPRCTPALVSRAGIISSPSTWIRGISSKTARHILARGSASSIMHTVRFMHALVSELANVAPVRYELVEHTYPFMDDGDETTVLRICLSRDSWEAAGKHAEYLGLDNIGGLDDEIRHAWLRITTPIRDSGSVDNNPCSSSYEINRQIPWVTYGLVSHLEFQLAVAEDEHSDHVIVSFTPESVSTTA